MERPYLVISDTQIPFENEKALSFCMYIRRHYGIPDENVLHVGDEVDNLHGGLYPKDPDGCHSPTGEITAAKEKIKEWAATFPKMKIAISNHGMRWFKKAAAAEIPSQMIRDYQQVLGMPDGWIFKQRWDFDTKHPFSMIHGMGYGGYSAQRTMALDLGRSVVHGHLVHAGIAHVKTATQNIWGMCVGCLIDPEQYAFKYGKDSRFKPCLGVGVITNEGRIPNWIPLE
jgi:hypothetical protein